MSEIKFIKKPKLKNPYLICAWPGMGDVAFKAASFLVNKLSAEEFAYFPAKDFFYPLGSVVDKGVLGLPFLPQGKFYYWRNPAKKTATKIDGSANPSGRKNIKSDLIIFLSNAQPDLSRAEDYCQRIISLAKTFKVKTVVSFAAMPQAIDHLHQPNLWFAATSKELNNDLKKYNFRLLAEGQISGMNGLFLGVAKREGLNGFCLLGEIPLYTIQIENPKASYAVLDGLKKILNFEADLNSLIDESHLLEAEINKLLDYFKIEAPQGPIGEEEIERIKKSLAGLTKLPPSIKQRIEKLFQEAELDLGKANELKAELDRWGVYKEYEDRFLDLFKKSKGQNN